MSIKNLFLLPLLFFNLFLFSQGITTKKVNSVEFNRDRNIKLYVPKEHNLDTIRKYPIAIVLDDDYLFDIYVGNSKIYANADLTPKQIVVGLDVDSGNNQDVSVVTKSGNLTSNAKKFYNYIKKELIPYLEANYRTSPYLTIVGDRDAGNFLLHFLKEKNPIFNAYVSISPKLSDQTIRLMSTFDLKRLDEIDNQFYLYVSSNPYEKKERRDLHEQLKTGLESLKTEKLHIAFNDFKEEANKPTALVKALPDAFSNIFGLYPRISKQEYDEKIKDLGPLEAIKYLETKYLDIEYLYGTNLNVRFEDIYAIEGIVIDKLDGDYLRVLGDFVMIKHPDSHLGEYYVGKFHETGKNYEQALFYYKEAYGKMELSNPNAEAFYENIIRIENAMKSAPKEEEPLPLEDEPLEDEEEDNNKEDNDDDNK
ncbi:alpha/beta hydrolase-fold protein [uncultured Tenacibaculum sp.]|uniref:alpha/beta hydrolase-fold protein n=1 Tax=uncultured Tenacibaculum sp. TaxID=174713 RepID=UPI0026250DA7|nr:alpha/beta hydrolase-fold protein [uncultured Tenacibaculum sp.]